MKKVLPFTVAVSFLSVLCNAQDEAQSIYGIQGNVAYNRSLHEKELMAAAAAARQKKELMAAMASQAIATRPAPRTAAEFLAANKPAPAPPLQEPRPYTTRQNYVPEFEEPTTSAPTPASTYTNPYEQTGIDTPSAGNDPAAMDEALEGATVSPNSAPEGNRNEGGGFLGKLFGKRDDPPADVPAAPAPPVYEDMAPEGDSGLMADAEPPASPGIPEPASWEQETPTAPPAPTAAPEPATQETSAIFRKSRAEAMGGSTATIASESSAVVNGVKVKLFPGTNVTLLESNGGSSTIQLPDGRTGTIDSSAISP